MKAIDETSMRLENMELLLKSIDYQLGKMLQILSASQKNVEEDKAITSSKIPEMLSIRETSKRTGLSYDYLRKQCLKGNLKHNCTIWIGIIHNNSQTPIITMPEIEYMLSVWRSTRMVFVLSLPL